MPNLASVVINDGKATPVAHTFTPTSSGGPSGLSVFKDNSATTLSVRPTLTVRSTAATLVKGKATGPNKVRVSIAVPIPIDVYSPGSVESRPEVHHSNSVVIEFMSDNDSSKPERKDIRVLAINALQSADLIKVIDDLEGYF